MSLWNLKGLGLQLDSVADWTVDGLAAVSCELARRIFMNHNFMIIYLCCVDEISHRY